MRKNLLIKPKLQLTHLFFILGIVSFFSFLGYIALEAVLMETIPQSFLDSPEWTKLKQTLRGGFLLTLSILVMILGIENYFYFHRIVGPIYALEKGLKRLSEGDFDTRVQLRATDELHEMVQDFEEIKQSLHKRIELSEKTARLLSQEVDHVINNTTVENIQALKAKLKEAKEEVLKKAA